MHGRLDQAAQWPADKRGVARTRPESVRRPFSSRIEHHQVGRPPNCDQESLTGEPTQPGGRYRHPIEEVGRRQAESSVDGGSRGLEADNAERTRLQARLLGFGR